MNKKMNNITSKSNEQQFNLENDVMIREIINKTKKIRNCIIYDEDNTLEEEKIHFDRIVKMYGDWTGYEVSCNEIVFDAETIEEKYYLTFAENLRKVLSEKYARNVVVYLIKSDNLIELRYHSYREDEDLWLDDNLDIYNDAILCCL